MLITLWLALANAADTCPAGQRIQPDTLGHCCWEGQAWNGQQCVGLPLSCPSGQRVQTWSQSCVSAVCPDGQQNVDGLHCCWPGQSWNAAAEACVGTPSCPPGYGAFGDSECIRGGGVSGVLGAMPAPQPVDPARAGGCPSGTQLTADNEHCCPPGGAWSSARGRCVTPPAGTVDPGFGTLTSEGGLGTPVTVSPLPADGDPIILGALDKDLINAVIRRHMNQIRYCYQRELVKNPDLSGKIVVKFVIAKDGTVSSAVTKSTTMNNAAVEDCINSRFMRMQFPEPKGGGIVIVSYPFVFESSAAP